MAQDTTAQAGPWEDYTSPQSAAPSAPTAPPAAEAGPWEDFKPQAAPAMPDMSGIHSAVQSNLQKAQAPKGENAEPPEPLSHDQALDAGMGMPVSKTIGSVKPDIKLSPEMRAHLMNAYHKGTAVDAGDFMQSAIPAASAAVSKVPVEEHGILHSMGQAALEGAKKNIQDVVQTYQLAKGNKSFVAEETPKDAVQKMISENYDFALPDKDTLKKVAVKTAYGMAESSPEIAGAVGLGAPLGAAGARLGGRVGGIAGAATGAFLGSAAVNGAKTIAPTFYEELKKNPDNPEAAFDMALNKTKISAVGTGLSFALFDAAPFKGAVKNLLFQALGAQPAVGAGQKAATNILEGKLVTEGTATAALQTAANIAVPLVGSKLIHAAAETMPAIELRNIVAKNTGKTPDTVTPNDIAQAIRMSYEHTAPKAQDFKDAASVMMGPEAEVAGSSTLRDVYAKTGVSPAQVISDAKLNPRIAEDIAAGKVPSAYSELVHKPPVEEKPETPLPSEKEQARMDQGKTVRELQGQIRALKNQGVNTAEQKLKMFELENNLETENGKYKQMLAEAGIKRGNPQNLKRSPQSAVGFLIKQGGIEPTGDIAHLDLGKFKGLVREGGMSHDKARAMLQEAGYLKADDSNAPPATTENDLHQVLEDHAQGRATYRGALGSAKEKAFDEQENEHQKASAIQGMKDQASEMGVNLLDQEALDALSLIAHGQKAEDAIHEVTSQNALRAKGAEDYFTSQEHRDMEDRLGTPEVMTPKQLEKLSAAIEGHFAETKNITDIPKYSDMSDAQFVAFEDYARRVDAMKSPVEESKLAAYLADESGSLTIEIPDSVKEFADDIKRDVLNFATPMETGSDRARASAKDFANAMRWNQWNGSRIFNLLEERYTPDELTGMWEALDASSDYAQNLEKKGMSRAEAVAQTERDGIGHFALPEDQKQITASLNDWARNSWERAKGLGMVEGEGFPFWTPRMAAVIGEDGIWRSPGDEDSKPTVNTGRNLTTSAGSLKKRKYDTAEETEAAMKAALGNSREGELGLEQEREVQLVRDIRTLPLALTRFNQAIAGRALIAKIKQMGQDTGAFIVSENPNAEMFTIDHPAFHTFRMEMVRNEETGKWEPRLDQNGNPIYEKVPIYVSKEFEGPLKAVLSQDSGATYQAIMKVKGEAMGLIMYSPLIHNAVEWGRALPAMPGKVATFKIYFEGNAAKKDPVQMKEAMDAGLVPIGNRFFNQDISSIMETPDLTPGNGWISKLLGGLTEAVSNKNAGDKVRSTIDAMGNFWHNTLLWDRVADLQMGLYTNTRDQAVKDGLDPKAAQTVAAHIANRFAGALPMESMGNMARKIANVGLFSRSFTIGNLGVMKDMGVLKLLPFVGQKKPSGLPSDVQAQLERDVGHEQMMKATGVVKRKAMAAFAIDIALMYAGNSLLQDTFDHLKKDKSLGQIAKGYSDRFQKLLSDHAGSPWELLNLPADMQALSSTSTNEPGKEGRIHFSDDPKTGTAYYMRMPTGKIGEEFLGWMTSPSDMLNKKISPVITKPLIETIFGDRDYFGHPIYDKNAAGISGAAESLGKVVMHIMKGMVPEDSIISSYKILTGSHAKDIDYLKVGGPLAGITFSKGYPGGPEAGILAAATRRHEDAVSESLPKIKEAVESEDIGAAKEIMSNLGMNGREQASLIRHYQYPQQKVNSKSLAKFRKIATPEEKQLMQDQNEESQPEK